MTGPDTVDVLLEELGASGVRIWADGGSLHYDGPADVLTAPTLNRLRAHKDALLDRLPGPGADGGGIRTVPVGTEQARMLRSVRSLDRPEVWINSFYLHSGVRLDLDALRAAATDVAARHESLRAGFEERGGAFTMSVHPAAAARVTLLDTEPGEADDPGRLHERCQRFAAGPLDLTRPPLLRLGIIRREHRGRPDDVLALCFHHVIADGIALELLSEELGTCYRARLRGTSPVLPEPQSFLGFLAAERHWRETELDAALRRRCNQLGDAAPLLTFPEDAQASPDAVDNVSFTTLSEADSTLFVRAVQDSRLSDFSVMLAALNVLITEITGESDFVLGVSAACRIPEYAETVGLVRRHLPVRLRAEEGDTWTGLSRRCLDALGEALEHPLLSLDEIRDRWAPGSGDDFPQLVMTYLPEMGLGLDLGGGLTMWEECPLPGARAGITFVMRRDAGRISGGVEVAGSLAGGRTRQDWLDRDAGLLADAARNLDAPVPRPHRTPPLSATAVGGTP
ncbi:condensation domain-containing protein [Streptomyces acidiscabies]|uniref:condensation domain-containing protein n=1 Tax=Streptomyces acidiscabies TaxID=42234 RepID=UPI000951A752|nr:condensation domain-containing protein [Streptomyces acidiscabies]